MAIKILFVSLFICFVCNAEEAGLPVKAVEFPKEKTDINLIVCPEPKIDNRTSTWSDDDIKEFDDSMTDCTDMDFNAPCLMVFRKVGDHSYEISCGK